MRKIIKKLFSKTNNKKLEIYKGKLDHVSKLFGFIVIENRKDDIKVLNRNLNGAFHGDIVEIKKVKDLGIVTKIIQRNKEEFVGKIIKDNLVSLDGKRMHNDIFLPSIESRSKAIIGDKVIVKITKWPKKNLNAEGYVKKILGKSGEHQAEMNSIIFEFDLPQAFPQKVIEECNLFKEQIESQEIKKRKDFRKILTFTIDPENAKDYDDALSIRKLPNNNYEVGVHIADASYYVKEDSEIDKEAYKRGNSIYLVDRTIPMLPEILSNKLCSLRPDEESLTVSAVFEINLKGEILNSWIGESIIFSNKRFVYEEAQKNIDNQKGEYFEELTILNNISKALRKKRFEKGSIYFSSSDFYIKLDEEGNPINITKKKEIETNNLIEEFMLLANKEVANKIFKKGSENKKLPYIYRIHDKPDIEKLRELSKFLKVFGYKFNPDSKKLPKLFNALAKDFKGKPEFSIIQYFAIRSMAKAVYSQECSIHFGLGFEHYTHFTSPIRRYSDLEAHRLLKIYIDNNERTIPKKDYKKITEHISMTERSAIEAERASIKYKQVLYMQSLQGKTLEGMISYISERALFIEILKSGCEGIVPFADIEGDYYILDKENFWAIGKKKKKKFRIGDKLKVEVTDCDIDKKQIRFKMIK
ncbi:MAG: ribonuclease R [Bacteroidetes bacterium]|nr:ribonuclease R [Bacteroidota bacterium]